MRNVHLLLLTSIPAVGFAQDPVDLDWFLPENVQYDESFPTPDSVLGWDVGTWHVRHDQLVNWFQRVAAESPRVQLETYGYTHEQRPLLLATVSSPENLARIEEIRTAHVESVLSGAETDDGPTVVWMGYSVHGNESSGSNAALLLAYHLAAAQGAEIDEFLADTVVLIDPCVNPDGLSRFAHWANMHRGQNLVGDPSHREHREAWPGGRTNHYWFDLNRDWLLLTHPESRGRLAKFHAWMPSVLTDYHEMGSDSTYFFQPGIPTRQNPLTPDRNIALTAKIAEFHAEALDEIGSLYYTEESFDDFYYGKGSTYPDINGCIGILFEQASSRGHLQENSFGGITFPFTIRNQFTTSLSTLAAAHAMRAELTAYQREFYRTARSEAARHPVRAYVFGAAEDPGRTFRLADLLRRHGIRVHRLGQAIEGFATETSFLVPLDQPQFRLVRATFETRTSWPDNTFYDVSSWTLPLSFDVPTRAVGDEAWSDGLAGAEWLDAEAPAGSIDDAESPVAWIFEWHHYEAPRALQRLLAAGVRARVATRLFRAQTQGGPRDFDYGTIVVPTGVQEIDAQELRDLMTRVSEDGLAVYAATSGLTPTGVDLGSGNLRALAEPEGLMLVGGRVSGYEAGEVWHYLDQRVGAGVSMVERDSFGSIELDRYTHLILVNGATSSLGDEDAARVRAWTRAGGVVIATKSSAMWAAENLMTSIEKEDVASSEEEGDAAADDAPPRAYADYEELSAVQRVAGTIFEARVDRTHPLGFGFVREHVSVFRNSSSILPEGEDPFGTPLRYTDEPLLSGFASDENVERISGTPAVRAARLGGGSVICLIDNPNFRGVWYGTNRLFANALYFGGAIKRTGPIQASSDAEDSEHGH